MKTIAIILYIILGIWALISFDTEKPGIVIRYYVANIIANPIKTVLYTFVIIVFTITSLLIFNKILYRPIVSQIKIIEPAFSNFKDFDIKFDSLNTTAEYVKIYERLRMKSKKYSLEDQILNFIDDSRFFYKNYPACFKKNNNFNQLYDLTDKTQVIVIRLEKYKETLLFIHHNPKLPDRKISTFTYEGLPSNFALSKILDPIFSSKNYSYINDYYDYFDKHGIGQYGSTGIGVANSSIKNHEWMLLWLPDPFNKDNNLNNLLAESVWLTKI